MVKFPHGWYLLAGGDPEPIGIWTCYFMSLDLATPAELTDLLQQDDAIYGAMEWWGREQYRQRAMRQMFDTMRGLPQFRPTMP
jgi:hypothetical protein